MSLQWCVNWTWTLLYSCDRLILYYFAGKSISFSLNFFFIQWKKLFIKKHQHFHINNNPTIRHKRSSVDFGFFVLYFESCRNDTGAAFCIVSHVCDQNAFFLLAFVLTVLFSRIKEVIQHIIFRRWMNV